MSKVRVEKVQELMKQEDLREAKIYVSVMGDEKGVQESLAGLNRALGYVRREIGRRIRLRFTPEISFALDISLNYSDHIQRILNTLHEEKPAGAREETL